VSGRGTVLLALARTAIERRLGVAESRSVQAQSSWSSVPWLASPGAAFVTLLREGGLRGCIGTLEAFRPLRQDVEANACAAAFDDPRFPPLACAELQGLTVEVSLLSTPEPVVGDSEAAILAALVPGRDGVVLSWHTARSTFLPQVWEQHPSPAAFLARLKEKAGLAPDFWHPEMRVERYRVEKWSSP
jgi:AmmeMemoRadiSam system protein A